MIPIITKIEQLFIGIYKLTKGSKLLFIGILCFFCFSCKLIKKSSKITTPYPLFTIEQVSKSEYTQSKLNYQNSIFNDSSIRKVDSVMKIPLRYRRL